MVPAGRVLLGLGTRRQREVSVSGGVSDTGDDLRCGVVRVFNPLGEDVGKADA